MSTDVDKPATKAAPDWSVIEADYRAGIKTLRQIGEEHGITEGAIRKRAKRDDWTRDLSERIQDKAEQLVRKQLVVRKTQVRTKPESVPPREISPTERQLVDANAQAVADIRLAHRSDALRARTLASKLMAELEADEEQARLHDKARTMKTLADALQTCIGIERQAYGMDAKPGGAHGVDAAPGTVGYIPPAIKIVHVAAPAAPASDD